MKFYHGTSSNIKIGSILFPANLTGNQREDRSKNIDVVFLTRSKVSAEKYANKAVDKFGGMPIVLEADPIDWYEEIQNGEIICTKAKVID